MQNKLDLINLMNVRISNFGKNKLMQKELEPVRKEKETKIAMDLNNLLQVRIKGLEKFKHLNNLRKQRLENIQIKCINRLLHAKQYIILSDHIEPYRRFAHSRKNAEERL